MLPVGALASAFVVALAWVGLAIVLGPRVGFVDEPDDAGLKVHSRPAVPLGGIGVFLGFHTAMAVAGLYDPWLSAATGGLVLLGLIDDRYPLSPTLRLIVEAALAFVIVVFPAASWSDDPVSVVIGVTLVLVAINAVNLFDGLDGLVGSSAIVAALGIAAFGALRGRNGDPALFLVAALAGFLIFNWHRARVFLGDNGSYTVGALLAYGLMRVSPEPVDSRIVVAAVLLGVFALDSAATVLRRLRYHRPVFAGDRGHLYDQLRASGWSVPRVVLIAAAVEGLFVLAAVGIEQVRNGPARIVMVVAVAAVALLLALRGGFLDGQPD